MKHVSEPVTRVELLGGSVRVSPRQFPHLHDLVEQCADTLHVPVPEVFVRPDPTPGAFTYGPNSPILVLNSALVDTATPRQLAFVIGRELGHIKCGHVTYLTLISGLRQGLGALVGAIANPLLVSLFTWQRHAELTADRAGMIACQDLAAAEEALLQLCLGSGTLTAQANRDEFMRQARSLHGPHARLALALQPAPYLPQRCHALREWAAAPEYAALWDRDAAPGAVEPRLNEIARKVGETAAKATLESAAAAARGVDLAREWTNRFLTRGGFQAARPLDPEVALPSEEPI